MKWINKGHELDNYAEEVIRKFEQCGGKIYLFGAGLIGRDMQVSGVNGCKVLSLKQYMEQGICGIIVITADRKNIPAIEQQLVEAGFDKGKDFFTQKEFTHKFFPVLSVYKYDLLYVDLVQICLTERCTLKCKDCAHGCFAVDATSDDMSLETAKKSADSFFSKVDIVREFVLIGGEPFLYKEISEIISYIGEKYRDKISIFSIVTNGTIIPKQEILNLCKKYNVLVRISDYSETIMWIKERNMQLISKLEQNEVSYILEEKVSQWMDYGFQTTDRKGSEDELIQVFDECQTPCREIRGSKYYYCVMARTVSENLCCGVGKLDYQELDRLKRYLWNLNMDIQIKDIWICVITVRAQMRRNISYLQRYSYEAGVS